jgi:hypothetical protein
MSEEYDQLDDPTLKEAIRRAFPAAESAPPRLRQRVEAMLATGAVASIASAAGRNGHDAGSGLRRPSRAWWAGESPKKTAVVAALVLIAVGFMVFQIWDEFGGGAARPVYAGTTTLTDSFAASLVRAHDNCAKLPDHHLVPGTDPAAMKKQLTQTEGVNVAAVDLAPAWQFKGAGICTVDGATKAAHLLYARGRDMISVFSMPAVSGCGRGGMEAYQKIVQNHRIAGIFANGAVYCIVGSSPQMDLTQKDLDLLLERVQADVGGEACVVDDTASGLAIPATPSAH